MKKLISILLSGILTVMAFSSAFMLGNAENASDMLTVDFEDSQKAYYQENSYGTPENVASLTDTDTSNGTAMQVHWIKVYRSGWDNNHAITNYASGFALYDDINNKIAEYKAGQTLSVSFDLKKNSAVSEDFFTQFKAALAFVPESALKSDNMGSVNEYVGGGKTAILTSIDCTADSDWEHYSAMVTVPCDGSAAFMLYGTEWQVPCDIYIDNITVAETNPKLKNETLDFEDNQAVFYENNYLTDKNNVAGLLNSDDESHGNVMAFKTLKVYREGWDDNVITQWPSAFVLCDSAGESRLSFKAGEQFRISFEIKKNSAVPTDFFTTFKAALIFGEELLSVNGHMGSLNPYINNGKSITLEEIDCTADDWVRYSAVVTAPCSGAAAFLLYGTEWQVPCDIYIDNITVAETNPKLKNETLDFEDNQAVFYENNYLTDKNNVAGLLNSDDESHGNVMAFKTLKVYREGWDDNVITQWPSAFVLCDSAGESRLSFKAGEQFRISFEIKKNSAVPTDFFTTFKAALIFGEELLSVNGHMGSLNPYINNGKSITLEEIDCTADDWVRYSAVVTAPCSGAAAFLLYGTEWQVPCDIYVDNINISSDAEGNPVMVECVNIDAAGGSRMVNMYDTDSFSDIVKPFSDRAKFDGWYYDEALTKPVKGVIGTTGKIYAKWRTEKQSLKNTYDEDNVEYVVSVTDNGYEMTQRKINGTLSEDYFGQYNVVVKKPTVFEDNQAVHFTNAQSYNWNWPALVKLYDDKTLENFVPQPNSAYKIKFKYKTDRIPDKLLNLQLRILDANDSSFYSEKNVLCKQLVGIQGERMNWASVETVFYTGSEVGTLALVLASSDSWLANDVSVWIDEIEIEEVFNTPSIYFETNGGNKVAPRSVIAGGVIPSVDVPQKQGCLFDGWFTDAECTKPLTGNIMPGDNLFLYAKWTEPAGEPNRLDCDFETCQYINDGTAQNKSDNYISEEVTWVDDPEEAYSGSGYISVKGSGATTETASAYPAVSFKNEDGSSYQLVAGKRYKISWAFRGQHSGQYIRFVTSQQVPTMGVNLSNSKEFVNLNYAPTQIGVEIDEWGTCEMFFIPEETGKVYMLLSANADSRFDIDSLKIESAEEDEASLVTFYDADGNFLEKQFGKIGERLIDCEIHHTEDKKFNGWRTSDGKLHTSNTIPANDLELYASYTDYEDLSRVTQDWKKPLKIDFEDSEAAKIFYGVGNNSSPASNGTYYVTGDSANAHSGDSYFKLYDVATWSGPWFRRFRVFNPDTKGNMVYLDPHSVYRVSFWLNLEKAGASTISLVAFDSTVDMSSYEKGAAITLTDAEQMGNMGKWVQYESSITTGDTVSALGFLMTGGWMTAAIDDITVTKLETATVTFDSMGGSRVEPMTVLTYDYAVVPSFPEREGYDFVGWYTDKQCKNLFDFNSTMILGDITLYAKWEKAFVPETYYQNTTVYTQEEKEVESIPDDAELDNQFEIKQNDKIKNVSVETDGAPIWKIAVIAAGALALVGTAVVILLLIKKKKQKGGK